MIARSAVRPFFLCLVMLGLAMTMLASPVLATDEPETTVTSVVDQDALEGSQGPTPALTVPPPPADDAPADWTYRYLVPMLIALAVVVVIVTTVQYFTRVVRKRYKVVE